jgi:ABC-type polysaccharide/polyol phosphate transport system ATPase subunit
VLETLISAFRRQNNDIQELWALKDLTFDVMPGQSIGIVGRNGAGKSTLLKLIARIITPTSGQLSTNGRISALLELGAGFHPDLTGRENIFLNGSVLGLSKQDIQDSYQAIVDFSELGDFIDVAVKHYSSGMYMRLGFSVAIHVQPDVLLIDEILAVGDLPFQTKCIERIFDLQRQGVTIILISHHTEVIRSICSQVLWIEHGELRASGPMPAVLAEYAAHYSQGRRNRGEGVGFRWGTGEMAITGVRLCGPDGQEEDVYGMNDPLLVLIEYAATQPVYQPHFDVTIFREDGLQITGSQPHVVADAGGRLLGSGVVSYRIDRLPLFAGEYLLTVAVHDGNPERAFDCHELAYPFTVSGEGSSEAGLVRVPAVWDWLPQGEPGLFKV